VHGGAAGQPERAAESPAGRRRVVVKV
jgi:hypothetical protein